MALAPCCGLVQDACHDDYDTIEFQPAAISYDAMCANCEIIITVSTEAERSALLSALHFIKTKTNTSRSGRVLKHAVQVSGVSLEAGDRLEPSAGLWDIMLLDSKRLPLVVTFWRAHYDDRNRCTDSVNHRNPIFCEELGSNPEDVLANDSLHTVCFGQNCSSSLAGNPLKSLDVPRS